MMKKVVALFLSLLLIVPAFAVAEEKVVNILSWEGYIDADTLANFEAEHPAFLDEFVAYLPDAEQLAAIDWEGLAKKAATLLSSGAGSLINSTVGVASRLFSGLFTFFMGFIFSIYLLLQKEKLSQQARKLLYAFLKESTADRILSIARLANKTFSNFLSGQCLEAVILGTLFFIFMTIFGFPYALMISVLIGVTALIPIFGAFIGCVVGAFMILMTDGLIKMLWFIGLFLLLQQLEGNLIYPKVVGNSVGLPSIWVFVAVSIGGSAFGVLGMLLFIPLSSVLYALLKESVGQRLRVKGISKRKIG